jgi:hypothetical protein
MTDENLEKSTGKENSKRQSTVAWVLTVIICTALVSVLFWQPEVAVLWIIRLKHLLPLQLTAAHHH